MIRALLFLVFGFQAAFAGSRFDGHRLELPELVRLPVVALAEDGEGFLWFAAESQLLRYDGHQLLTVDLPGPAVRRMLLGPDGALYLALASGLLCLPKGSLTPIPISDQVVSAMAVFDQQLWLGTDKGLFVLREKEGVFQLEARFSTQILDLQRTSRLLVLTEQGLFQLSAHGEQLLPLAVDRDIAAILCSDRKGRLWLNDHKGQTGAFLLIGQRLVPADEAPIEPATTIIQGADGALWVLSRDGRLRRDGVLIEENGEHLFKDSRNHFWLTVAGEQPLVFPAPLFSPLGDLNAGERLRAMAPSRDGLLLLGSNQGRLFSWDPLANHLKPLLAKPLPAGQAIQVVHQGEVVWLGGEQALYRLDRGAREVRRVKPWRVLAMSPAPDGRLWLATRETLHRYEPESGRVDSFPQLEVPLCLVWWADRLWLGSEAGLTVFRESDGSPEAPLVAGPIHQLLVFEDQLWVAAQQGLFRVRAGNALSAPSVVPIVDFGEGVLAVAPRQQKGLWILGRKRLGWVDDHLRGSYFFDRLLPNTRFQGGDLFYSGGGLFLPSNQGLLRCHVKTLEQQTGVLPRFTAVLGTETRSRSLPPADRVVTDRHELEVHFSGGDPATAYLNEYAYRLDGLDQDWEVGREGSARYERLPAGRYTLRMKARGLAEQWVEGPSLQVLVPTAWYLSAPMLVLYVLLTASGLLLLRPKRSVPVEGDIARLKDQFLNMVSHELRTPLHGMIGLARSVRDGASESLDGEARRRLDQLLNMAERLSELIGDLLDLSLVRARPLTLEMRPVEMRGLVALAIQRQAGRAGKKGLELRNQVPEDLWVLGDEGRLQQILNHLLDNGIKFTTAGWVAVGGERRQNKVVLWVKDTGAGFNSEDCTRLFAPFQQGDASTVRPHPGAGIGLAVVYQLVQLHGGLVEVDSETGRGATFRVFLKAADPPSDAADISMVGQPSAVSPEPITLSHNSKDGGARILIVDDESINRQVLVTHLADGPFHLRTAANGEEALDILAEHSVDLVLLDIMMPRLSGYDVCRRIRESHDKQQLPVLMLTARSGQQPMMRGFQAGANDYLVKPVAKEELLVRVDLQLQLLEANRAIRDEKALLAREMAAERATKLYQEAEIRLLHAQMNPHFVQNTLTNAIYFINRDPVKAEHTLAMLSRLLRQSFRAAPAGWWPLEAEWRLVQAFLNIQKVRFGERLETELALEDGLGEQMVPCFLVQPLVENAVEHGFKQTLDTLQMGLSIREDAGMLEVAVGNNGQPLARDFQTLISGEHALGNINKRLQLLFDRGLVHDYQNGRHTFSFAIELDVLRTAYENSRDSADESTRSRD